MSGARGYEFENGFPIQFGKIHGYFNCEDTGMKTLRGCPSYVEDNFICSDNELTSLEYCPTYIGGYFDCESNKIQSANMWHTVIALEPGCVLLEVKAGPFDPNQPKDLAPWAADEGSAAAAEYLEKLKERVTG